MDPVELLLDTVADLRRRTDLRSSQYDFCQASGLVRRLLIDDHPLAFRIAKSIHMELQAEWGRLSICVNARDGLAWVPMLWLDPDLYRLQSEVLSEATGRPVGDPVPVQGRLSEFLSGIVVARNQQTVRVGELVVHYAVREGGVHHDEREARNGLVADVLAESPRELHLTMLAAARVVYRSVEPLATYALMSRDPHPFGLPEPDLPVIFHRADDVQDAGPD